MHISRKERLTQNDSHSSASPKTKKMPRIFWAENVKYPPGNQIWYLAWIGRTKLPARFWLVYTQWNWLGYIIAWTWTGPWNYRFIHADRLVWASVTQSGLTFLLTFARSRNFDSIIQPHVVLLITSFSRQSMTEMKFFSMSLFVSPDDDDVRLKSVLQVAQLVRQGVNPCLPNATKHHDIPLPQGVMSSVCKYIRCK